MNLKHLLAGSIVTAAVATALVLGGTATAQASIFPPPKPIGPGSVTKPIYNAPSYPGFHLPAELWTKYGPQIKPSAPQPFTVLPASCGAAVGHQLQTMLDSEGYTFTGDSAVHATQDPQLLALLAGHPSVSCRWVQFRTGARVDVTDAIGIDNTAVSTRLRELGFSDPTPWEYPSLDVDGVLYTQNATNSQGGWTLVAVTDNSDLRGLVGTTAADTLLGLNE